MWEAEWCTGTGKTVIPRWFRGNGDKVHGNTTGMGTTFTVLPRGWGVFLRWYRSYYFAFHRWTKSCFLTAHLKKEIELTHAKNVLILLLTGAEYQLSQLLVMSSGRRKVLTTLWSFCRWTYIYTWTVTLETWNNWF